jgi:hypothetical protein
VTDRSDAGHDATSVDRTDVLDDDRRRVLRLAGSATVAGLTGLAGCNGLAPNSNDEPTIESHALREAVSTDVPAVPRRLPVAIESSYVDQSATSAQETLDVVPAPLTAAEIPNGEVREQVTEAYQRASDGLGQLAEQPTPVQKLATLEYAHRAAGSAAAGWEAVDTGYGFDELGREASALLDDLEAFRRRWRYVADDPITAVLVHAAVEHRVTDAGQSTREARREMASDPESVLAVSDAAGAVARARTNLADASYLYDRFRESLEEPRTVGDDLQAAVEALRRKLDDVRESLPDPDTTPGAYVDADLGGPDAVASFVLRELREVHAAADLGRERARGLRARQVLTVHRALVQIRAFQRFQQRVERGETVVVEDAAGVRKAHERAIRSLDTALEGSAYPELDRQVLPDLARTITYRTTSLEDDATGTDVRVENVRWRLSDIVAAGVQALVTPEVSAEVAETLEANL